DIVIWTDQSQYYSKIAIVRYTMGVNVGTYAAQVRGSATSGTCTTPGCQSYKFTSATGTTNTFSISTCVSERTGTNAYTDVAPSTALLGRNYPASSNPCLQNTIVPLTSDKTVLENQITLLKASGSTAGHVGVAWGWYMLSPNFAYLWPAANKPASYSALTTLGPKGAPILQKIVTLMTDGEYNSPYCNGVISKDATSGSGNTSDHINCNAQNGGSYTQAKAQCTAMKKVGITVYTVGFQLADQNAVDLINNCASDSGKVYNAADGTQL